MTVITLLIHIIFVSMMLYANVWGNKNSGDLICPRKDHKDMFVEMDYFSGYQPSIEAIKDVIMAFGNAPITNLAADDFGRTKGITLHFVLDESLTGNSQLAAWSDTNTVANDDFDSIKLGCPTCPTPNQGHFGTAFRAWYDSSISYFIMRPKSLT